MQRLTSELKRRSEESDDGKEGKRAHGGPPLRGLQSMDAQHLGISSSTPLRFPCVHARLAFMNRIVGASSATSVHHCGACTPSSEREQQKDAEQDHLQRPVVRKPNETQNAGCLQRRDPRENTKKKPNKTTRHGEPQGSPPLRGLQLMAYFFELDLDIACVFVCLQSLACVQWLFIF